MKAPPRTWLVLGTKQGDNAQVEALVDALGWPCERREIALLPRWETGKPRVRPSLEHLDLERSDPLEPPWPDLVITIGRRPSMAALWIQEQSGGRTRIVLLGKPSGSMERFDLVVASEEVNLPPLPNLFKLTLPLMRVAEDRVRAEAEAWRERLAPLPRPLVAFLVGGTTHPFVLNRRATRRIVALATQVAEQGGTPYVTTSRRTPAAAVEQLESELPRQARLFRWAPDRAENPYRALLGLADGFVVTGDSISMQVEVLRLGRPLAILPLPYSPLRRPDALRRALLRRLFALEGDRPWDAWRRRLARALFRLHLVRHSRDFAAFHRMLVRRGLAVWAGEPFVPPAAGLPDELERAARRVRALVETEGTAETAGAAETAGTAYTRLQGTERSVTDESPPERMRS